MQLWVGLGNPGAKYALQRHNVGFMVTDIIAEVHGFSPWSKKFRSLVAEGRLGRHRVLLLKPQTFMNDSGDAVQQAMSFYKLDMDALTVFHDELDLAPFKVKVKLGGGTAGHNGLRSIDAHLGPDFRRVRIGIGHPGPGRKDLVTPHVLGNYAKTEMERLSDLLAAVSGEAEWLADGDEADRPQAAAKRMTITIREASAADRAQVIAIWQECGLTRPWNDPAGDFDRALAFVGSAIFVAEDNGNTAGTVMTGFDGHRGWIYYLGVTPERREEGIARRLVEACADWLRNHDCPKVELMLREGNSASGLYERLGWELQQVRVYARWLRDSE